MKKITLLLLLCLCTHLSYSQILFEDDFDGSGPGIAGWTVTDVDGQTPNAAVSEFTAAWIEVDKDASGSGGPNYGGPAGDFAVASTSWYTPAGTSDDWLITPQINLTSDATLYWDAKAQDDGFPDGYEVRLSTSGTNTATDFTELLFSIVAEDAAYQSRQVDLSAYTGQNVYIAFRNNSTDQFVLLVDNVEVSVTPSCVVPTDFTAGTVTATTYEVTWMDTNAGTPNWEIEWGADGFTQGTGTSVTGLTSTSYTFPGLMPETTYNFFIRTNCGGAEGDSDWVGPVAFTTLFDCSTIVLPLDENFVSESSFNSCYGVEDIDANGTAWIQQALDLDGDLTDETFATNGSNGLNPKDDWLVSPAFPMTMDATYTVDFSFNGANTATNNANESLEVLILDGPTSSANVLATLYTNTGIVQTGAFAELENMATNIVQDFDATADGTFHVAFRTTSPANSGFLLLFNYNIVETLSVDEFDRNNFSYIYNKDTDQLTLESTSLPLDSMELYSILGQKVVSRELSQNREVVDMSRLTDGVYLATVTINGSSKTFKIVKQ
ncbi:T9SS-dependent choice-of-anchor J family protein [Psychroserpens luteolus]|uniref:T9SS-dependent choice-of-anchor J family protein n=1 Tax=Psychroserpens luteolus TaxID=2855840 RepID=UPI001E613BFE|nr:choice-of-anchor J domain-containing protein [Psychroserpens luteolus]MCD2260705.1 choice-of-anchor J domain-containing protein [Psychroserpens luteolus]